MQSIYGVMYRCVYVNCREFDGILGFMSRPQDKNYQAGFRVLNLRLQGCFRLFIQELETKCMNKESTLANFIWLNIYIHGEQIITFTTK